MGLLTPNTLQRCLNNFRCYGAFVTGVGPHPVPYDPTWAPSLLAPAAVAVMHVVHAGVLVLAATNRPESLDEALTRPGRFDRVIQVPYPSVDGRIDILKVHSKGKQIDPNLNWRRVSRATAGFSGADLMNLMNIAAIEAVREVRTLKRQVKCIKSSMHAVQPLGALTCESHTVAFLNVEPLGSMIFGKAP
jgi:SpoVK/Ycf46/Vps4 family AAA+-type ATPase